MPNRAGVYYIIYDAKDSSNNKYSETSNIEVKREIVVRDIDAPVITLNGESTVRIEVGSTFSEPGYEAIDDEDGDITSKVETSSNLNTRVVGTYTVQYIVIDSSNNRGIATRTIEVVDTTKPTITKVEGNTDNWTTSKTLTITASDNYRLHNEPYSYDDGVTWQAENTKVFTENKEVKIKVRDESENVSEVSIVNIEKVDSTEPSISLNGVPDTIEFEDSYSITPTYTANGPSGGSAVCKIGETEVTNTNTLTPGAYTINCTVTTGAGKTKQISKSITVKQPQIEVVMSALGNCQNIPKINDNNIVFSAYAVIYKMYLDKVGYTFDYLLSSGQASISFCDNSNSCGTLVSHSAANTYTGSYTTTKPGYIGLTFNGCSIELNNIKYKGHPVKIVYKTPPFLTKVTLKGSCTISNGALSCENNDVPNNSTVTGNVYITFPNSCYAGYTQVKINNGEWVSVSMQSFGGYYSITTPGTYRIKLRNRYNGSSHYSEESDEYVVTIK